MKVTHALTAGCVVLAFVATLFCMERAGRSQRRGGPAYGLTDPALSLSVLDGPREVFSLWQQKGIHGVVAVHIGHDLHFAPVEKPGSEAMAPVYPVVVPAAELDFGSAAEAKNFLWLAMRTNMARQLVNVLSHEGFREKVSLVQEAERHGYLGILALTDKTIVAHELGSRRVITDGYVPAIDEPVVLNVDASIFDAYDPAALYGMIEKAGLRIIHLTCSLSKDNAEVKDSARTRLREFARLVAQRGKR